LVEDSRDIFAFEWEDPQTGRKQQYRWTVLPQGFIDSPNLFDQVLEQVLEEFALSPRWVYYNMWMILGYLDLLRKKWQILQLVSETSWAANN
jgi:hypothetical protein